MSEVTLKEYVEKQIAALESATDKAEIQLNRRLEGMNEIRESLRDQASKFLMRSEYDLGHAFLTEKIRQLELNGAKTSILTSSVVSIIIGSIIGVIVHFIK